jgi:hypothetical protein
VHIVHMMARALQLVASTSLVEIPFICMYQGAMVAEMAIYASVTETAQVLFP